MWKYLILFIALSLALFIVREYSQQARNQNAATQRLNAEKAAIERQNSVPFRPSNPNERQRQR